jgi:hypothetical protein|uniref:Uncharacterized protein n=1 Tax=Picea glauca TaxID=3330 RepID=A0A101M5C2_PICGL|nr:hypothetical protein ABT39_MTgene1257 [Picea glauca]
MDSSVLAQYLSYNTSDLTLPEMENILNDTLAAAPESTGEYASPSLVVKLGGRLTTQPMAPRVTTQSMESNSNKFLHKNKIIIKITEISHQFCT